MRGHVLHHLHKRMRIQKGEKYPHPDPVIRFLDDFLLIVAIIAPFTNLPQLVKVITLQDATGVSALSWGLYAFFTLPWIVYGFVHKEPPVIVINGLWLILDLAILIAVLIF